MGFVCISRTWWELTSSFLPEVCLFSQNFVRILKTVFYQASLLYICKKNKNNFKILLEFLKSFISTNFLQRLNNTIVIYCLKKLSLRLSVQFSLSDSQSHPLRPHGLQHSRLSCPSPSAEACSNSCPLSQWCHPTIWSSVIPFASCLQSFPASGSFLMSWLFVSSGQSLGASASPSVLPMNIQDWFPLGLTGLISLQSKGLTKVFLLQYHS